LICVTAWTMLPTMKWKLYRYLLKELLGPFLVSILVFTIALLLSKILSLTEVIMTRGVSISSVLYLFATLLPFVFTFTLPMSSMLSVVLAFLRLSVDNELTAIKNAGVSLYQLLPPVLLFSTILCLLTMFMSIYALPWGNYNFKMQLFEIARVRADIAIKESVFNNVFDNIVIYAQSYDSRERMMKRVLISDERDPKTKNTIVAPIGYLLNHPDGKSVVIRLFNGTINRVDNGFKVTQSIAFDRYDINVDLKGLQDLVPTRKRDKEMSLSELRAYLNSLPPGDPKRQAALVQWHHKFILPLSCLVLGMLGVSLGLQTSGRHRSKGIVLALAVFIAYYLMLTITSNLGEMDYLPIGPSIWSANIIFALIAIYMLVKSARESPVRPIERINVWAMAVASKIKSRTSIG
jgi:lipopolysaccharide export system permease protein